MQKFKIRDYNYPEYLDESLNKDMPDLIQLGRDMATGKFPKVPVDPWSERDIRERDVIYIIGNNREGVINNLSKAFEWEHNFEFDPKNKKDWEEAVTVFSREREDQADFMNYVEPFVLEWCEREVEDTDDPTHIHDECSVEITQGFREGVAKGIIEKYF